MVLTIPGFLTIPLGQAKGSGPTYWNTDGDFLASIQNPYYEHEYWWQVYHCPWGVSSWGAWAQSSTGSSAQEYILNANSGIGHAWVNQSWNINGYVSEAGYVQGPLGQQYTGSPGCWYIPPQIPVLGESTIFSYRLMIENTAIDTSAFSSDYNGVGFDILMTSRYNTPQGMITKTFVIDLYIYQSCGPLVANNCAASNNTSSSLQHTETGNTWFIRWRILNNPSIGSWVSGQLNLSWYLSNSIQIAYCLDNNQPVNCTWSTPQGQIGGLTVFAEAFGGTAGFAFDYIYLLPTPICTTSASPTSGVNLVTPQFSASCTGGTQPYAYFWQFNDPNNPSATSNAQSPSYTYYLIPGDTGDVFYPTVTVTDAHGAQVNPTVPRITVSCSNPCPMSPSS
jgi:hypothetical protein